MYKMRDSHMQQQFYNNNNNYYLPPPHSSHHRQHRTARRAAAVVAAPQLPPPQRVPSPNCCSSSAATSSTVSEPISLDLATHHYFVKEKENWREEPNRRRPRRFPPRPLRRTPAAEGLVIPLDGFRTEKYSSDFRHPIVLDLDTLSGSSEDDDDDEDNFVDGGRMAKFDGHPRRYSTSDLTTSDSELGRFGAGNANRLAIKFPSVSTINPDDSSDLDQMIYQPRAVQLPKKLASSRRFRHKRADFFAAAVDLDDCAKSDAELTERPPSHRHGRQHARRMNNNNNNNNDAWSPPPPPSSRGGTQSAPRTPQRRAMPPALEMIEEISPVLPRPADVRDDLDIPPLPRPLQLSKEWRPLQTSTLTNFHATLPKTNPRYATKLPPIAPLEPPRSLFDPQYTAMCCGISSTDEFNKPVRPEQFNLPSVMAKAKGIRGILFLQLCVTGDSVLKVQVRNGAYFLKSLPISSFVKVEIRRSISSRRRDKYAAAHHQQRRFCSRVTYPVSQNNQPEFYEEFTFRISRTHLEHGDKLGISVFVQHSGEEKTPELLGGMSFSLVKMIKMAHLHTTSSQQRFFHYDDHQSHLPMGDVSVKLYEGGFFLLPDKKALTTKFAQDKISIRKYYDDIGGCSTTMSTTTSSMGSPFRMMSEPEWSSAARFGLGTAPPNYATVQHRHRHHHQQLCTSSSTGTKSHAKQLPSQQPSSLTVLAPAAMPSCAAGGGGASAESGADTSHYTTSNSSSSGAHSAVDCKRTRAAAPTADVLLTSGAPPAVPPPSVNTTDTTTSDFTSSGFTSSAGGEMVEQTAVATLANSFSSGCAEVGGGTADGSCSSDESASSSPAVVVELATNFNGHDDDQQQQPRKSSLQHHYFSPMRMHRGGCSPQKSGPSAPPPSSCELIDQYQQQQQQQQQSPKRSTKAAPSADGRAGRLRTALAATDTVRRVASFTFSPPGTLRSGSVQHNNLTTDNKQHGMRLDKRNSVSTAGSGAGGGMDKLQRKTALGPLSKTLHFLRTKLDFSMSASVLCPSREDCRLWQESFEALLAHKYGCLLFREFLQSEFSEENLEFWLECEEFKRMKTGKKSTAQKANQIFDNFVRELAPKEVNLDSQTRLATQAALEVVPLRTEMFTMAQHKIEQLMAKDSYPRFLKSEQYLELLNNNNNDNNAGGEQQQHHYKGLLRVASAREGSAKSLSGSGGGGRCSRSPSLSPKLRSVSPRGTRWSSRRNTCAPTATTTSGVGESGTALTLQIPSIAE